MEVRRLICTCLVVVGLCCGINAQDPPCECVPYFQCHDGKIKTDGSGLATLKRAVNRSKFQLLTAQQCTSLIEICCTPPSNTTIHTPALTTAQLPHANQATTPLLISSDEPPISTDVPPIPSHVIKPIADYCGVRRELPTPSQQSGVSTGATHYAEFPWMILIQERLDSSNLYKVKCGGSLVHPSVIVTAAQCVAGMDINNLKVRAGEWDLRSVSEPLPYQDRTIREIRVHPDYNPDTYSNDIAVIIVDSPFNLADNVHVICLPLDESFDDKRCVVSGWGKDSPNDKAYKQVLRKVELRTISSDECQKLFRKTIFGKYFVLHESFICTRGERGRDTCLGDGGSPLVCPSDSDGKRWIQVGIVAWGIGCGGQHPSTYTKVSLFNSWIIDQIPLLPDVPI